MGNISKAVVLGFKEIVNWHTMKYILLSGILVTAVWIGLGYVMWDGIVAISAKIIELVPFSMVRSNGAWMLSTFLWLQLVLITFALIYAFLGNLILRSVSQEKYTVFSLLILLGSGVFWGFVWFFKGDYIYAQFIKLLTWLPFETVEKGIAFLIGFYIIYNAIVVTMLFVSSMVSDAIIEDIEIREFAEDEVVRDNLFKTVKYTVRDSVIFAVISILAFPLLFVPILNIFIQIALWIWLTKDTIAYNALALTHTNVNRSYLKQYRGGIWSITAIAVLFNFIPVLNIFGPYFGLVALFYYMKLSKKQ
jgi:hypothetical protein